MSLSELISKLQQIQDRYTNLEVVHEELFENENGMYSSEFLDPDFIFEVSNGKLIISRSISDFGE